MYEETTIVCIGVDFCFAYGGCSKKDVDTVGTLSTYMEASDEDILMENTPMEHTLSENTPSEDSLKEPNAEQATEEPKNAKYNQNL